MAKHKSKAKYRKYNSRFQVLPVQNVLNLSTLADATVVTSSITAITDDFWVQSADLTWTIDGNTAGEAPIFVGLNNGDLSVTEIKEALQALPASRSDIVSRERARRPVRRVGGFSGQSGQSLNDGKPIRTTIKMYLAESTELEMFALNNSGATLTTGGVIDVYGVLYGEWR